MIDLEYMTVKTAAKQWSMSQKRVLELCAGDRIEGLARVENLWLIPKDAPKPAVKKASRRGKSAVQEDAARPFVKWAGGKGQLLDCLRERYPAGLGTGITKYCEPFVGGGAVLFDVLSRFPVREVYISDVNVELINAYNAVKGSVEPLTALLEDMQAAYLALDGEGRKEYYYEKRNQFNALKTAGDGGQNLEKAALFLFLNRTCFNGLYRVNRKGCFNVPIGSYKNPAICDRQNLLRISRILERVRIACGDYRASLDFLDASTFVYLDPPYRPLSTSSSFTAYTEDGFDDQSQRELADFFRQADQRGAKLILSNSDPKNTDENDNFFDDLYAQYRIHRIYAVRAINSNTASRGRIRELLITNF